MFEYFQGEQKSFSYCEKLLEHRPAGVIHAKCGSRLFGSLQYLANGYYVAKV
jgi:hypothetical protein